MPKFPFFLLTAALVLPVATASAQSSLPDFFPSPSLGAAVIEPSMADEPQADAKREAEAMPPWLRKSGYRDPGAISLCPPPRRMTNDGCR